MTEQLRKQLLDAAEKAHTASEADWVWRYDGVVSDLANRNYIQLASPANIRALIDGYDKLLQQARSDALEEAARACCLQCKAGIIAQRGFKLPSGHITNDFAYYHGWKATDESGSGITYCNAGGIYALLTEEPK